MSTSLSSYGCPIFALKLHAANKLAAWSSTFLPMLTCTSSASLASVGSRSCSAASVTCAVLRSTAPAMRKTA
eukprot:6478870-Pyramimonas_sp.AAC.1